MIDWKTIKDLHANKKLEEIIGKWFGVDIFILINMEIFIHQFLKKTMILNHFFKVQMHIYLMEKSFLAQDIEKGLTTSS